MIGIGFPTRAGTHKAHSDAPGEEEIRGAKKSYGWPEDAQFRVPEDAVSGISRSSWPAAGAPLRAAWEAMFARYREQYSDLAHEIEQMRQGKLPDGWEADLPTFEA